MFYYVYVIYSSNFDRYYIGQTIDLKDRIRRHNSGSEKATFPFRPWQLVFATEKYSRKEAMDLERKLKNLSRVRLISFIKKYS